MSTPDIVMGPEAMAAAVEDLKRKVENGEISAVSFRVFRADGTWEDVALGNTAEEREEVMSQLRAVYRNAH